MIADILKMTTPDVLLHAIKSNQGVVLATLHKLDTYKAFGEALSEAQQVAISNNMDRLALFMRSKPGKESLSLFGDEFIKFIGK